MIKYNEPNPLNIFNLRQITHCPPHFHKVEFDLNTYDKVVSAWIYENLEGRFNYGQIDSLSSAGKLIRRHRAAFELAGEASYFALCLVDINTYPGLF